MKLPPPGRYAVAMCFLPRQEAARDYAIRHFETVVAAEGQAMVGWRDVPTDITGLGERVIETMPVIRQAIVAASPRIKDQDAFERKILAIRKQILNNARAIGEQKHLPGLGDLYMPSFSTRTMVYKGCCWRRRSAASISICATR